MGIICIKSETLLCLIDEVGRARALTNHESEMLQDALDIRTETFEWTEELCTDLLTAAANGDGVRRFARRIGISDGAAYQKLFRLRRQTRKGRKLALRLQSA